ncbi:MAG: pyridoxamine 5'-phosphate oxidase family protein [Proteobacteria bacterium]|nr:pyridoxamine 5'-phosphate oxidase family protein [Pseudomonadota bacterium]
MKKAGEKEKPSIKTGMKKHTKSRKQLEKEILAFLNDASTKPGTSIAPGCQLRHGLACVLATVHDTIPRATPVDFFNDGLVIWIAGEPGLKIRNIRSNPSVAVGIYHPVDHSKLNRSLQIQGTATLLNLNKNKDEVIKRAKQFGIYQTLEKMVRERSPETGIDRRKLKEEVMNIIKRFNFIRIAPDEIIYLSIDPAMGTEKNVWKRETNDK